METLPFPVRVSKHAQHSRPWSREGSATSAVTRDLFFRSLPKNSPHLVAAYDTLGDAEDHKREKEKKEGYIPFAFVF
jgi:hypothetical protein